MLFFYMLCFLIPLFYKFNKSPFPMHHPKRTVLTTHLKLKRTLGYWGTTIDGVGVIVGAGIYALIGVAAGVAGPALWISFVLAGIIAVLTGLSYAELSSIFKTDAGEYDYLRKAFNRGLGLLVSFVLLLAIVVICATISIAFGGYLHSLTGIDVLLSAAGLLILACLINFRGLSSSTTITAILTFCSIAGLLFIIGLSISRFGTVNLFYSPTGIFGIVRASALVFFAYVGFEAIIKLTEETKNPTKTIPHAILSAITITTVLYILVALSAVSVLGWKELSASSSPLADVARSVLGNWAFVFVAVLALVSTTNTVMVEMVAGSRMVYGLAERKELPAFFLTNNNKNRVPRYAILIVFLASLLFLGVGNLELLAHISNLFMFGTFVLVNFSLIALRYKMKKKPTFCVNCHFYGVPVLPLLGGILSLTMLVVVIEGLV